MSTKCEAQCVGLLLGVLAAVLIGCGKEAPPTSPPAPSSSSKAISEIAFSDIAGSYAKGSEELWQADKKYFAGKRVRWTGVVASVEASDSGYWIKIDLDPDSLWKIWDVTFRLDENEASNLRKNQEITFEGDIEELREGIAGPRRWVQVWLGDATIIR